MCGGVTWTNNFSGSTNECGASGVANVTFFATDDCGNTATTHGLFTIRDNTAPNLTSQAQDISVECDGNGNTAALNAWLSSNGGANASDDCSNVTWTNNFNANNSFANCDGTAGTATVTFTGSDQCGNTVTTQGTFTIVDALNPVITQAPSQLTV